MRVSAGPLDDIPTDSCVAIADGLAIIIRVGDRVVSYQNRCLHMDSPFDGGRVENGRLICPLHFWRYEADSGRHLGRRGTLASYPTEVVDDEVFVDVPDPEPKLSVREMMLRHAAEWRRE